MFDKKNKYFIIIACQDICGVVQRKEERNDQQKKWKASVFTLMRKEEYDLYAIIYILSLSKIPTIVIIDSRV